EQINSFDSQISTRSLDLIGQVAGSHAMHSAHQFALWDDAGVYVLRHEVGAGIGRNAGVVGEVTGLRAEKHLVSRNAGLHQLRNGPSNAAFRSLKAVVDRAVEHIHAGAHRFNHSFGIPRVGGSVRLAEVGAKTHGREPQVSDVENVTWGPQVTGG